MNLPAILRSPMTWLLVIVVVAAAVVFTSGDDADEGAEVGPVTVSGSPLPLHTDPDPAIGSTMPTVDATVLGGGSFRLGPDGTAKVIGFLTHWCSHCQAELPVAREWLRTTTLPAGVEVLAVSTSVDATADNFPPSAWFAREDWPTPVLVDDERSTIGAAFGLARFPYWVVVDGEGTVLARTTGELTPSQLDALAGLAAGSSVEP